MPIGYSGLRIAIGLVLLIVPAICAQEVSPVRVALTEAEKAWIETHPGIRMMAEPNWQPGDFIDADGQHRGIGADVLELVASRTGLQFQIVNPTLEKRLQLDPDQRGADGVVISAQTPERSKYYLLTTPYLKLPAYIITRQSVDRIVSPNDLKNCRVSVVAGYASQEYMRANYPAILIDAVPDTATGLNKVAYGLVDAFISSIPVSTFWLEKEGFANLKINGETGFIYELGISSRKDWPLLHSILQKGQDSITQEEHEEIRRKWLNLPYEPFFRSRKFWWPVALVVGGITIIALLLAGWNRFLSHKVRQKTEELRRTGELHRTILESISDAVFLTTPTGEFVYISPNVQEIFGMGAAEIAELGTVFELLGQNLRDRMPLRMDTDVNNIDCKIAGGDARPREFLVSISAAEAGTTQLLFVCRDVTERSEMQGKLQQKQKLESIGLLAGGVAHDFNNLMQAVQGFTDLASHEATTPADRTLYLGEVNKATERAVKLTRQLLSFARKVPLKRKTFDLNEAVLDMLSLIRGLLAKTGTLNFQPFSERLPIHGDPSQIEQVVLNLALNARDAMPPGGEIRVSIGRRIFDAAEAERIPNARTGTFAQLQVRDTGAGMDKATIDRIFEPFFTTKGPTHGTGLGLAVVHGVVETHGGFILVDSKPGQGSTFTVYLPLVAEGLGEVEIPHHERAPAPAELSVLLADDEPQVLALSRRILEKEKHRVTAVSNGQLAVEQFAANPAAFQIVLLDLMMPIMGGRQAAVEIRKLSPRIPILFISGHESPKEPMPGMEEIPILTKPFRPEELVAQLRLLMEG